jgi:hypothetical protein
VEAVSRRRALEETRGHLAEAVARARSLGLRGEDLRSLLDEVIEEGPDRRGGKASGGPDASEGDRHELE